MRLSVRYVFIMLLVICSSCEKESPTDSFLLREGVSPMRVYGGESHDSYPKVVDYAVVPEGHPALECMRNKAQQIASIRWTPLRDIPGLTKPIPAGVERIGIPYSSVKEKDKFIGLEVSFHTFMTALHNPRSVLYTDDVKESPYYGTNCGPYYGTVCSTAINYALGLDRPFESSMYENIPYIAKVKNQSPEGVCPGDILWSKGHVVLVLDVKKGSLGEISGFSILESNGRTTIKEMSLASFKQRWESLGWVVYRNLKLAENTQYTPIPYVYNDGDAPTSPVRYNEDLCTSRGDRVTYVEGEDVVINILSSKYKFIDVLRDGVLVDSRELVSKDVTYHSLPSGSYVVRLRSDNSISDDIVFEVINERTKVGKNGDKYCVSFGSSNGEPLYLVICSRTGARSMIVDISSYDVSVGGLLLQGSFNGMYLKVFYQGQYGRVSNEPIKMK